MDVVTVAVGAIGAIVGASFVGGVNLYIFRQNRKRNESKERLKNLYYPLYAMIEKKRRYFNFLKIRPDEEFEKFAIEYYEFFLNLRDTYLDNKIYESPELRMAFNLLIGNHEMESYNYYRKSSSPEELIKNLALFELKHKLDDNRLSELERNIEKIIEVIDNDISKMM